MQTPSPDLRPLRRPFARARGCPWRKLRRLSLVAPFLLISTTAAQETRDSMEVEFYREIRPIFTENCVRCHGLEENSGGLRLDQRSSFLDGGESGPIHGTPLDQNVLYQRIVEADPDRRMPLGEDRLAPEQIDLLRRWILQGAEWPGSASVAMAAETFPQRFDRNLKAAARFVARYTPSLISLLLVMLGIVFVERSKKMVAGGEDAAGGLLRGVVSWAANIGPAFYVMGLLAVSMLALLEYQVELAAEIKELNSEIERLRPKPLQKPANGEAPQLRRPKHPPRLAGTYYRGNDERSDQLFNGGFYLTATFHLALVGADGELLQLGDEIPAEGMFVRLEIEKARGATPRLFGNKVIESVFLSSVVRGTRQPGVETEAVRLEVIQPHRRWGASYRVPAKPNSADQHIQGTIYLYKGALRADVIHAQYHYGIQYDLRIEDGRIAPRSEVWMANLFPLGRLMYAEPGKIPLTEWFDFRPMPVVTGENTKDARLLGIEEHFGISPPAGENEDRR